MTELKQLYLENRSEALEKIQNMSTNMLFAELHDTVVMDMLKCSAMDWLNMPHKETAVFFALLHELHKRVK